MATNSLEVFNCVLRGVQNVPITAYVQMISYWVNDYFVLRQKVVSARLSEAKPYPTHILAKVSTYGIWASSQVVKDVNFQQGLVELKTGQSSIKPSRRGHVQLVDLQNKICTCQKP